MYITLLILKSIYGIPMLRLIRIHSIPYQRESINAACLVADLEFLF